MTLNQLGEDLDQIHETRKGLCWKDLCTGIQSLDQTGF